MGQRHMELMNKNKGTWTDAQIYNNRADTLSKMKWRLEQNDPLHAKNYLIFETTKWHLIIDGKHMTNNANNKIVNDIESNK